MPVEICTVGGYNEVGKNCTAIKVDDEVILIDLGIHLESYIKYTQDEDVHGITSSELIRVPSPSYDLTILSNFNS